MSSWIREELGTVDLGDERLNERLLKIGEKFLDKPTFSISQGQGDWASVKAAYRFFDNEKSKPAQILQEHVKKTCERIEENLGVILAIQDTTILDYSHFPKTEGLGEIYRNHKTWKDSEGGQGFLAHTTLALTPEGLPLGILDQKFYLRKKREKKGACKNIPIEEKETFRWVEPIMKTSELVQDPSRMIHICDREGDIFESFWIAQEKNVKFVIRASYDRAVGDRPSHSRKWKENASKLWDHMKQQAVADLIKLDLIKTESPEARIADCELKYSKILCPPPRRHAKAKSFPLTPVEIYAVWIREINPPQGVKPLEWMLLTNIPVNTIEEAYEKTVWYRCRWHIENFFKILKSGCKVEDSRLDSIDKLKKLITLKSIISFRIYWMTWMNRVSPEADCRVVLSESEWKALYCFKNKTAQVPEKPPTLTQALTWIAMLGGFLGRRGDGPPGSIVIWRGWQELTKITQTWEILNSCTATYG